MAQQKSIGIWIRVSTEDQVKGESPEHHERRARLYAEAKGWHVAKVYHLEALSGKSVMAYPQTTEMLADIRSGLISGLIFSKLARLARNTKELLEFADIFREEDCDLISLQESIDTSTPAGRLFYTMIAAMAQWEREEIADRVAASVPVRAKMGKSLGGQPSLGYKWAGNELVIDEEFAPVRKLIYDLFLTHRRKKTVANLLNEQGYRTRNGSKFSDTTVDRLLRDPMAKGERRANYTKSLGDGKKWTLKPQSEWVILPCPALVSPDLWDQCNHILDESERKRNRLGKQAKHLLSGYVYCTCSTKMYVYHETRSNTYSCKKCKVRIAETDLDEIYHDQLRAFLLTDMNIGDYLAKIDDTIIEKRKLLDSLFDRKQNLKKTMDKFVQMRINDELSKESFKDRYKPLEEQMIQINDQIPELQAEIDFLTIQHRSSDTVLQEAKDLHSQWSELSFEDKRSIVEVITEKIIVGKEDITIKLAYLPNRNPPTTPKNNSKENPGNKQRNFRGS